MPGADRLGTMKHSLRPVATALIAGLLIAACSSTAGPTPSPSASFPAASPIASDGVGGNTSGDPGPGGSGPAVDPAPIQPGSNEPALVIPRPGQQDPHPVVATSLEPNVSGRRVVVKLTWYSGVEPCNVLDSVKVESAGNEFILTIIEGTSDPGAICMELAQLKATIVDLGELEPGQYTVSSPGGEAQPAVVTIS
jgi:hypothetical protein